MSPKQIEVGKAYHNGKKGARSYAARVVLEMGVTVRHADMMGTITSSGVRYRQIAGRYIGKECVVPLTSFAIWARGEVEVGSVLPDDSKYPQRLVRCYTCERLYLVDAELKWRPKDFVCRQSCIPY